MTHQGLSWSKCGKVPEFQTRGDLKSLDPVRARVSSLIPSNDVDLVLRIMVSFAMGHDTVFGRKQAITVCHGADVYRRPMYTMSGMFHSILAEHLLYRVCYSSHTSRNLLRHSLDWI